MKAKRSLKKSLINELVDNKIHPITGYRWANKNQKDHSRAYNIRLRLKKGRPVSEEEEAWLSVYTSQVTRIHINV